MENAKLLISSESQRTDYLNQVVIESEKDRAATIKSFDSEAKQMLAERLAAVSWREKDSITARLRDHMDHDPRKYLPEYQSHESPYFGVVSIEDDQIGSRTYVIGKETLMDKKIVAIVDWRKAPVSRFFYEYEEGEDYDEEIQGKERTGIINDKRTVLIQNKELLAISKAGANVLKIEGEWLVEGQGKVEEKKIDVQISRTADPSSHVLPDIVALISADQFRIIASQTTGCVSLTGGAGSGKTSVAIHRLSYLQYNYPEKFQPERCLVMMFNRPLRDYVSLASANLLGDTAVDTFASWTLRALKAYGISISVKSIKNIPGRDCAGITKSLKAVEAVNRFIADNNTPVTIDTLWDYYHSAVFMESLGSLKRNIISDFERSLENKTVAWSDLPILLKLCQASNKGSIRNGASEWYHHIIVDEAQDFGYLELDCLFTAANSSKSLTVCSDSQQHILPLVDSQGLSIFQEKLHLRGLERENLKVSYRCPTDIMSLALSVRAGSRTEERAYPNVSWHAEPDYNSAKDALYTKIQILAKNPNDLTAVICKKKSDIPKLRQMLNGIDAVHSEGNMNFEPGVLITNVHQVKGLEFDHVVLWNPCKSDWGASQTDVNLLYVAITRAAKSLSFVHYKPLPGGIMNPHE